MPSLFCFSAAVLSSCMLIPVTGWLILVCADFLGLVHSLYPETGWTIFACVQAAALVLPPSFHLCSREGDFFHILREGMRAMLLSLTLFLLLFTAVILFFLHWLPIPSLMLPMVMKNLAAFIACPMFWVSYCTAHALLPLPQPHTPPPQMKVFGFLAALTSAAVILLPLCFQNLLLAFPLGFGPLPAAFLFFSLRQVLFVHGNAGFVPAWGLVFLASVFWLRLSIDNTDLSAFIALLCLIIMELVCFICLLHPSSRRWFV